MKKGLLLILTIFLSCENEIVDEMRNFNGIWRLKSTKNSLLLENAKITMIDFGNGVFSRKLSKTENSGKLAFLLGQNKEKRFQLTYRVVEPAKLKFQLITDYRLIEEGTFSSFQPSQLSKELEATYAGEWQYSFESNELFLIEKNDTLRFEKIN